MKNYLVQCLFVCLVVSLFSRVALAFEEEHEAHEHGHATLMVVQEKNELQMMFKSPAMNIVGFEHQPSSPEQKAKIEAAEKILKDANRLFQLSSDAKCDLEHVQVSSALLSDAHGSHDDEHESHDEHKAHEDEHESHDEHKTHEDEQHDEESHSEFEAEYHFECANMAALKEVNTALFEAFTSIEEIEAQVIAKSGQKLAELDHDNTAIKF